MINIVNKINSDSLGTSLVASSEYFNKGEIIIHPVGYSRKVYLRLGVVRYESLDDQSFVAKIISHRNFALTQQTKNRAVSLGWIKKFIKHNEKEANIFVEEERELQIVKEKEKARLQSLQKETREIRKKQSEAEYKARKIEWLKKVEIEQINNAQKEKARRAKYIKEKEERDKKSIIERKRIDDITNKIKPSKSNFTNKSVEKDWSGTCPVCLGDGGVNQGCYKCDGKGWN